MKHSYKDNTTGREISISKTLTEMIITIEQKVPDGTVDSINIKIPKYEVREFIGAMLHVQGSLFNPAHGK